MNLSIENPSEHRVPVRRADASAEASSFEASSSLLLSVSQLVLLLNISRSSIYAMEKRGAFPRGRKIGSLTRWVASDISVWIDSLKTGEAS